MRWGMWKALLKLNVGKIAKKKTMICLNLVEEAIKAKCKGKVNATGGAFLLHPFMTILTSSAEEKIDKSEIRRRGDLRDLLPLQHLVLMPILLIQFPSAWVRRAAFWKQVPVFC